MVLCSAFGCSNQNNGKREKLYDGLGAHKSLNIVPEHYNESVILLKNLLCWYYKDVASLKLNSRKKSAKSTLSAKAREALKEYLAGDYM
ncbi:hypothetical protein TCAL_17305 [Tigriopus californicus]|uniref:Uncharacterized protein n=1 Tax=Tigriopus californicus TaxID=6832 RepID=A0A553P0B4_TIGCA|nr:hypothetical protein TCAL_17305 [Tigriopus californicus]